MLKKAICILFLGSFLISSTELRQLLKLPLLIQHFTEHQQENKNITIWEFLSMHYEEASKIDLDYGKDQKLPFKSDEGYTGASIGVFVPTAFYSLVERSFYQETVLHFVSNEDFVHSVYLSSIWQPPKA